MEKLNVIGTLKSELESEKSEIGQHIYPKLNLFKIFFSLEGKEAARQKFSCKFLRDKVLAPHYYELIYFLFTFNPSS